MCRLLISSRCISKWSTPHFAASIGKPSLQRRDILSEELSLCSSAHWEAAAWLVEHVDEDTLVQVMSTQSTPDGGREARIVFIQRLHVEYRDNERLAAILRTVSGDAQTQQSVMREALKHIIDRAYSKYSSVYPDSWFQEMLRDRGKVDGFGDAERVA